MDYTFGSWIEYDDHMYFYLRSGLLPMKYSLEKNSMELAPEFDFMEDEIIWFYIDRYHRWNDSIIGLKRYGGGVVIWNMKEKTRQDLVISAHSDVSNNYVVSTFFEDCLYIFPRNHHLASNKVICIDLVKGSTTESRICDETDLIFSYGFTKENEVLLISEDGTYLYRYDLEKKNGRLVGLTKSGPKIVDGYIENNNVYLLRHNGEVLLWNVAENAISIIVEGNGSKKGNIVVVNDMIILLPYASGDIDIINTAMGLRKTYKDYPSDFKYTYDGEKFYQKVDMGTEIIYSMSFSDYIMVVNKQNGNISWKKPIMPLEKDIMSYIIKNKKIPVQEKDFSLHDFLSL